MPFMRVRRASNARRVRTPVRTSLAIDALENLTRREVYEVAMVFGRSFSRLFLHRSKLECCVAARHLVEHCSRYRDRVLLGVRVLYVDEEPPGAVSERGRSANNRTPRPPAGLRLHPV